MRNYYRNIKIVRGVNRIFNSEFKPLRAQARTRQQRRVISRIFRQAYIATFQEIQG